MDLQKNQIVKPTSEQVEWADCEIGILVHYDLQIFCPGYEFGEKLGVYPEPSLFNPSMLNTDQWIQTAKAAGAKYAVLVAKHGTGFCLWPTEVHEYSVKYSPWKNGKGDIVREFIGSCSKFGIKPGLYYSVADNAFFNINRGRVLSGNQEEQNRYNKIVIQQLTELWSNYGELFEIWFDGGVLNPREGGPDIEPLMKKFQPTANVFQGPHGTRSLLRWVGNEDGNAPYPCWSTSFLKKNDYDGTENCPEAGKGDPSARIWAPAESDMPNRKRNMAYMNGWVWKEGEDGLVYPAEYLVERYFSTVANNTNLLLGMVIDNRGLAPTEDVKQFTRFGELMERIFDKSNLLAEKNGTGNELTVDIESNNSIGYIVIMEDIEQGERILKYKITGWDGTMWKDLCSGISVGHKRIHCFTDNKPEKISGIKFECIESKAEPVTRRLAVYK